MNGYWLMQYFLADLQWAYLLFSVILVSLVVWRAQPWSTKMIAAAVSVALLSIIPLQAHREQRKVAAKVVEVQAKAAEHPALLQFTERCKSAGEKILRTVEGVDGVHLLNLRERGDRTRLSHNVTRETYGEGYIRSFLAYERLRMTGYLRQLDFAWVPTPYPGYRFVEIEEGGALFRYTVAADRSLRREQHTGEPAHFGVAFEEPRVEADRGLWIAESTVRVVDLRTREVLAESTRYVMDPGQGNIDGGRDPWAFARGCRLPARYGDYYTRFFVDQVLKPAGTE